MHALEGVSLSGHQVGLLYPPERGGSVRARVVSVCGKDFIPACGGMTQVLGKALVETELADWLGLKISGSTLPLTIEFDTLSIDILVHVEQGKATRVETDFTPFAFECQRRGIEHVDLDGTPSLRVGNFFILNAEDVQTRHPFADFEAMDKPTKELLVSLQWQFLGCTALTSWDTVLYDRNPEHGGDVRAVYPHNIRIDFIEPSCGTGSVALALALASPSERENHAQTAETEFSLVLETGGRPTVGGPDFTEVKLRRDSDHIVQATFSNNNLAIVAAGKLMV